MVGQGLKPRRGGLFIANVHTFPLSFCFSAARIWRICTRLDLSSVLASALRYCLSRTAEKQKEGGEGPLAPINRPPLRGLSNGCSAELLSGKDEPRTGALR